MVAAMTVATCRRRDMEEQSNVGPVRRTRAVRVPEGVWRAMRVEAARRCIPLWQVIGERLCRRKERGGDSGVMR